MSATKRQTSLGVDWYMPKAGGGFAARRFATTTVATSDLIRLLAHDGHTVQSAHDAINFDVEAKAVLTAMADKGFGQVKLDTLVQ